MSKPFVRRAQAGDERGIHDAHMLSIKEVCKKDYTPEQINAWGGREFNHSSKQYLIENQLVWVVELDNNIEGYGLLVISQNNKAEIGALYFTPKVLGHGLGREIIEHMKQACLDKGIDEILLSSTITSKGFYEKLGFHQYEEDDNTLINGVPIPGHPMKISLITT